GRHAALVAAHQIGGEKPLGQISSRSVKHRSSGRRFLSVAGRTFVRTSGPEHFVNLSYLERDINRNAQPTSSESARAPCHRRSLSFGHSASGRSRANSRRHSIREKL